MRKEAAQGEKKTEVAPTPVTTSGVEGRKGVSWGTVKTHKVYVIASDGDDNGSEVSSSLVTPDVLYPLLRQGAVTRTVLARTRVTEAVSEAPTVSGLIV